MTNVLATVLLQMSRRAPQPVSSGDESGPLFWLGLAVAGLLALVLIGAFIAYGLLCTLVGWLAPVPPRRVPVRADNEEASA